jgi:hypothetical protein
MSTSPSRVVCSKSGDVHTPGMVRALLATERRACCANLVTADPTLAMDALRAMREVRPARCCSPRHSTSPRSR